MRHKHPSGKVSQYYNINFRNLASNISCTRLNFVYQKVVWVVKTSSDSSKYDCTLRKIYNLPCACVVSKIWNLTDLYVWMR